MTTFSPYSTGRIATPVRDPELIFGPSFVEGAFDSHAVDCPFVFSRGGVKGMTYVGWDGIGYQTALAWSDQAGNWSTSGVILARDPDDDLLRYNAALTSIVRDNDLR